MLAFQISEEDVMNVLARMGRQDMAADEDAVARVFGAIDGGAVEKAALYGDDMDEQTGYAMDEIEKQIQEGGLLS